MKKTLLVIIPLVGVLTACNNDVGSTNGAANQTTGATTLSTEMLDAATQPLNFTWVGGSTANNFNGNYDKDNGALLPPARSNFAMWRDNNGLIWLFGGTAASNNYGNSFNDLWSYDPKTQMWSWVSGASQKNQDGVYGTKNLPDTTNTPGARSGTYSWTDANGNFWLFGGNSGKNSTPLPFNDLWKFDVTTKQWTWVAGSNQTGQQSVYGAVGAESTSYTPGARFGGTSWSDESGNLWLVGGDSYGTDTKGKTFEYYRSDVWRFNTATKKWALMSPVATASAQTTAGGTAAVFGTLNVEATANTPPGLLGAVAWKDSSGNAFVFGGATYSAKQSAATTQNALWKFNPGTRQWSWVGGSKTAGQVSVYGAVGVESAGNVPSSRYYASSWTDASGNFWLIDGDYDPSNVKGVLTDIWRYNVVTKQWSLMGGSTSSDVNAPVYNTTMGVPESTSSMGSRISPGVVYDKTSDSTWLFGGTSSTAPYADLWSITNANVVTVKLDTLPASMITWNNSLESIPGNQFGLSGFLFTNKSNFQLESINIAGKFPTSEFWFDQYRSTCLVKGTSTSITLPANSSCSLVIHYEPTVLDFKGVLQFGAQAKVLNGASIYSTSTVNIPYSSRPYAKCNIANGTWTVCATQ